MPAKNRLLRLLPPLCLLGALLLLLSRGAAAARVTEALSDAALVGGGGWRGEQKETRGEERLEHGLCGLRTVGDLTL